MKELKRLIIIILICFPFILLSCSNNPNNNGTNTSEQSNITDLNDGNENNEIEITSELSYDANLPDMDFEKKDLRILNMDQESM